MLKEQKIQKNMKIEIFKALIYIIVFFTTFWSMSGLNLNSLFKQNRVYQARIIYFLIAMAITCLVTNCLFDFYMCFSKQYAFQGDDSMKKLLDAAKRASQFFYMFLYDVFKWFLDILFI